MPEFFMPQLLIKELYGLYKVSLQMRSSTVLTLISLLLVATAEVRVYRSTRVSRTNSSPTTRRHGQMYGNGNQNDLF